MVVVPPIEDIPEGWVAEMGSKTYNTHQTAALRNLEHCWLHLQATRHSLDLPLAAMDVGAPVHLFGSTL